MTWRNFFLVIIAVLVVRGIAFAESPSVSAVLKPLDVASLQFPDVRIESAVHVEASQEPGKVAVGHVKVDGVIGKAIRFEVLLPDQWNGRFAMGGGGGLVGSVQNSIRGSVNEGYATAGTDTGHHAEGTDGSWALNDLEAFVNFGHAAIHRTAEVAKALIRANYGKGPEKSYFVGCSRGGGQAMMEAQRYPEDFDGIVAGAPAFDWAGIAAMGAHTSRTFYPDPKQLEKTVLTQADLDRLYDEVIRQTDEQDGLKDGIIGDPASAHFDLSKAEGFTEAQRAAIQAVYDGPRNSDGPLYPGFPLGAEGGPGGWFSWLVGPMPNQVSLHYAFSNSICKYFVFHDASWDYSTYNMDTWKKDTHLAATVLNATDPNLDGMNAHGGKLILWHGWSDAALPAGATIDYYKSVLARDPNAENYVRLFMVQGCYHCGGGPGISGVNWLAEIQKWVEEGVAPDVIMATKAADGIDPAKSRPLFPYPAWAKYDGDGDGNDGANFVAAK